MKFYFAGAIRGGREKIDTFIKINDLLEKYGIVLDKHVANPNVQKMEEKFSLEQIYERDINWINECDLVVAEVSTPSLGVGYEIAYAENINKNVICVYDKNSNVSAMIKGNNNIELIEYKDYEELIKKLETILSRFVNNIEKIRIDSIGEIYSTFETYQEYQKIINHQNNTVIYTTDSVVMAKRKEASKHYGLLKYIGKGHFFYVPYMSTTYNIGLLKMQFDENNRLVPFSEEIIHLNSYDDIMNYLKETLRLGGQDGPVGIRQLR